MPRTRYRMVYLIKITAIGLTMHRNSNRRLDFSYPISQAKLIRIATRIYFPFVRNGFQFSTTKIRSLLFVLMCCSRTYSIHICVFVLHSTHSHFFHVCIYTACLFINVIAATLIFKLKSYPLNIWFQN